MGWRRTGCMLVVLIIGISLVGCGQTDTIYPVINAVTPTTTATTATSTATTTNTTTTTQTTAPPQTTKTAADSHRISGVPVLGQFPEFPTGCESLSAVMALRHAGCTISVDDFVDKHLPKDLHFYYKDGQLYGPNPYTHFLGNPRSEKAYGCMAPVIKRAMNACLPDTHRAVDVTGTSLQALCRQYINKDKPVLLWVAIYMMETKPGRSWRLENGDMFTWPTNEHCMVLVGYDRNNYFLNDPYSGTVLTYPKSRVEGCYAALGQQAVVIE